MRDNLLILQATTLETILQIFHILYIFLLLILSHLGYFIPTFFPLLIKNVLLYLIWTVVTERLSWSIPIWFGWALWNNKTIIKLALSLQRYLFVLMLKMHILGNGALELHVLRPLPPFPSSSYTHFPLDSLCHILTGLLSGLQINI